MTFRNLFDQRQAKTPAAGGFTCAAGAEEWLEDAVAKCGGDGRSGVRYRNAYGGLSFEDGTTERNLDWTAAMFERVFNQVADHAAKQGRITPNDKGCGVGWDIGNVDCGPAGLLGRQRQAIDALLRAGIGAMVEPTGKEYLCNQRVKLVDFGADRAGKRWRLIAGKHLSCE